MLQTVSPDFGSQLSAIRAFGTTIHTHCRTCDEPLSPARKRAQPGTSICTKCLLKNGDVPVLRRFDETTYDGDRIETYFYRDSYIEQQLRQTNARGPRCLGDDNDQSSEPVMSGVTLPIGIYEQSVSERLERAGK